MTDTISLSGNRELINGLYIIVSVLGGVILALWIYIGKRQHKDDANRAREAEHVRAFTEITQRMISSSNEMTKAVDRNTEVVKDNTRTLLAMFSDPHIKRK